MAQELAPRFQLVSIIRTLQVFFSVFALLNGHTYLSHTGTSLDDLWQVRAAFAVTWIALIWNLVYVILAAVHPHLQRLADGLPFPVSVSVRGRTILSYGDGNGNDDETTTAALVGKAVAVLVDLAMASLLLAFGVLAARERVDCLPVEGGFCLRVPQWQLNVWWTLVIFQYVVGVAQGLEMAALWYKARRMSQQGRISLL